MKTLIDGSLPRHAAPSLDELLSRVAEVLEICTRNGASNLWVFGSVGRGEQHANSDLDLAMDTTPAAGCSTWPG